MSYTKKMENDRRPNSLFTNGQDPESFRNGRWEFARAKTYIDRRRPTILAPENTLSTMSSPSKTLFERIAEGEIPADFLHKDDLCIAFRDINPQAPVHFLVVPRKPIPTLDDLTVEDQNLVGHLFLVAQKVAAAQGLTRGYRAVFNCREDAFQTVPHVHLHILGGRKMGWPPG